MADQKLSNSTEKEQKAQDFTVGREKARSFGDEDTDAKMPSPPKAMFLTQSNFSAGTIGLKDQISQKINRSCE